jgi:hypothetical protein
LLRLAEVVLLSCRLEEDLPSVNAYISTPFGLSLTPMALVALSVMTLAAMGTVVICLKSIGDRLDNSDRDRGFHLDLKFLDVTFTSDKTKGDHGPSD